MTEQLWLITTLTLLISYTRTDTMASCSSDSLILTARSDTQEIVFPNIATLKTGDDQSCSWVISASSQLDVINFQVTDWFDPDSHSCVVIKDGGSSSSPTLRNVCGDTYFYGTVTSTTSSIFVQFNALVHDGQRGFALKYWGMHKHVLEETTPEYGPANYVLILATAAVTLGFLGGLVCLFFREKYREQMAKDSKMKQLLQRRRQGISGMSGNDVSYFEHEPGTDTASFVNVVTPPSSVMQARTDEMNMA